MFSDADPAVALDPKHQHGELTKPGIYSGIPVAVSCLPKINPMHRHDLPGKHALTSLFCVRQKFPQKSLFFLVIKTPKQSVWLH